MLETYSKLKQEYEETFDMDDPVTAFGLMKMASAVAEFLEVQEKKYNRIASELEKRAECIESEVSAANGKSVAEGKRFAATDKKVIDAWNEFFKAVETAGKMSAYARHSLRIYYDSKRVYENGEKKERYNG